MNPRNVIIAVKGCAIAGKNMCDEINREWFEKLRKSNEHDWETFNKPQWRNFFNSIIDKYSDRAHFVYEFLQNADDAEATEADMVLYPDKLVFTHNGIKRFTLSNPDTLEDDRRNGLLGDINSITYVSFSSKTSELELRSNKIGKFGIGFKSVFQYTQAPHIYDNPYCFKIKNLIIPILLDDKEYQQEGKTVFVIPFDRDDISQEDAFLHILQEMKEMEYPQLFLNHINTISWKTSDDSDGGKIEKIVDDKRLKRWRGISTTFYNLKDSNGDRKALMMSRMVDLGNVGKQKISVCYFLDEKGQIITKERPYVHCFFPTKQKIDTCFAIHAPFELTDSREGIKRDSEINKALFRHVGDLAAESLGILRHIGIVINRGKPMILGDNILDIMRHDLGRIYPKPRYSWETPNPDTKIFEECYKNEFHYMDLFLSRNNRYLSLTKGWWAPKEIQRLLDKKSLNSLTMECEDFILCSLDRNGIKGTFFDINVLDDEKFASLITSRFMKSRSEEWLEMFYDYVVTKRLTEIYMLNFKEETKGVMRTAPIIKTKDGDFVAPFKDGVINVYFGDDSGIVNIVDPELYEKSESLRKLVETIGVTSPTMLALLRNRIEQQGSNNKEEENKLLANIMKYYRNASERDKEELLKMIRDRYRLHCNKVNNSGNNTSCLVSVNQIYRENEDTRRYFNVTDGDAYFLDMTYYEEALKEMGKEDFEDFLSVIKIKQRPQVRDNKINISKEDARYNYDIKGNNHQKSIHIIEGLEGVLQSLEYNEADEALSHYVWNLLCYYENIERERLFRSDYMSYTYRISKIKDLGESTMVNMLRESKWLLVDGKKKCPEDGIYREDLIRNGYQENEIVMAALDVQKSPNAQEQEAISKMSEESQEAYKLGKLMQKLGIKDPEEIKEFASKLKEEKSQRKLEEAKRNSGGPSPVSDYIDRRQDPLSGDDFRNSGETRPEKKHSGNEKVADAFEDFDDKVNMLRKDLIEIESLRDTVKNAERYSYAWMKALMELEVRAHGNTDDNGKKSIRIEFWTLGFSAERDDILILKEASRSIPSSLEDIDGIPVSFIMKGGSREVVNFNAASVKDNTLILKGGKESVPIISRLRENKTLVDRALINMDKPIEIIKNWKSLLGNMSLKDNDSLKQELRNDLRFIFGPPGTGKTTRLAEKIKKIIALNDSCRILVLAPTNSACDVLTEKILDMHLDDDAWLWRFMSTMSPRVEQSTTVHDRESDIVSERQVCLISTFARYAFDGFIDNRDKLNQLHWDYIIIDEASMVPLYQIISVVRKGTDCDNIIIAGDPFQIEPIVKMEEWKFENIYTMINLQDFVHPTTEPKDFSVECLTTQYRSIPAIGNIYSHYKYGGLLQHARTAESHRELHTGLSDNPLNIISFPVTDDSVFAARRIGGSNIQVYSAIFASELVNFIAKNIASDNPEEYVRVGVIGPYGEEIDTIQKLFSQRYSPGRNVDVMFGTTHSFQGNECDIVIVVANPPASGMVRAAEKTFINRPNILNVAVSRAKDYLYLVMPDKSYRYFDQMVELKTLGAIMDQNHCGYYSSSKIEAMMFGTEHFIEANTFVTSHQTTNVYSGYSVKYEVHMDEDNIDITVNLGNNDLIKAAGTPVS